MVLIVIIFSPIKNVTPQNSNLLIAILELFVQAVHVSSSHHSSEILVLHNLKRWQHRLECTCSLAMSQCSGWMVNSSWWCARYSVRHQSLFLSSPLEYPGNWENHQLQKATENRPIKKRIQSTRLNTNIFTFILIWTFLNYVQSKWHNIKKYISFSLLFFVLQIWYIQIL